MTDQAAERAAPASLTPALEDYLETIYRLVAKSGFARVRDIARARDVSPAACPTRAFGEARRLTRR